MSTDQREYSDNTTRWLARGARKNMTPIKIEYYSTQNNVLSSSKRVIWNLLKTYFRSSMIF